MPKIIISDTSCFIILTNIGELELLNKVYGQVVTTTEIAIEFGENLPEWVRVLKVTDIYRQKLLELQIDKGEASAIALALENTDSVIVLDDNKARKIADQLAISYTGTIGIIIKAKKMGIISSIKPLLEKIKLTNFRISPAIEKQALFLSEEY